MKDFSRKTINALAKKGITIYSITLIPSNGPMPYANGDTGYKVNDNGCGRIWTYSQVMEAAA